MSFFRIPVIFFKHSLMKSTLLIETYSKTTFTGTYSTLCLKSSLSLSNNDQEEAVQSEGDTKASYDPKKCDGKTGRMGQWIYHRMVEEPKARCTSEYCPTNHHEQEKEGEKTT